MHYFKSVVFSIIGVAFMWVPPAQGQAADELLELVWATTQPLYSQEVTFERVLVYAEYADELLTLDDMRAHPFVLGVYDLTGEETNGVLLSKSTSIVPRDPSIVPDAVAMIAEAYRAEPRSILEGYMGYATASKSNGLVAYTIEGNGAAPTYTLFVNDAEGRIAGAHIGAGPYTSLKVQYDYDAAGAIARVVVEFSTNEHPEMRWALVDIPVDSGAPSQPPSSQRVAKIDSFVQPPLQHTRSDQQAQPKNVVVTAPVELAASDDLIDPINLGTTSCTASDGICFEIIGLEICFNIGLGVALNTNTTLTMNGEANIEYPLEGREGEARITFTGTTGTSSIDYSFAYDAEICASATVPVLGTCNSSFVLAQDSFTAASGEQAFSPFLLPGDAERPVCTGDSIDPLFVGTNPGVTLCDLELSFTGGLDIDPNLDYCVSGDSMVVATAGIFTEGGEAFVPAVDGMNTFQVDWNGQASLAGSVTLTPALGVTIPGIGDVTLPLGSFPLQLGSLGINSVSMSDMFQIELCSAAPRKPFRVYATKGVAPYGVNLDWQEVPMATGYRVFRARKANLSDAQDISGVLTELWYTDTTATTGMGGCIEGTGPIKYYYYIVAVNACGVSPPSSAVTGYVGEPKSLATLSPSSFGDFSVFVLALAMLHYLRRRRNEPIRNV